MLSESLWAGDSGRPPMTGSLAGVSVCKTQRQNKISNAGLFLFGHKREVNGIDKRSLVKQILIKTLGITNLLSLNGLKYEELELQRSKIKWMGR